MPFLSITFPTTCENKWYPKSLRPPQLVSSSHYRVETWKTKTTLWRSPTQGWHTGHNKYVLVPWWHTCATIANHLHITMFRADATFKIMIVSFLQQLPSFHSQRKSEERVSSFYWTTTCWKQKKSKKEQGPLWCLPCHLWSPNILCDISTSCVLKNGMTSPQTPVCSITQNVLLLECPA